MQPAVYVIGVLLVCCIQTGLGHPHVPLGDDLEDSKPDVPPASPPPEPGWNPRYFGAAGRFGPWGPAGLGMDLLDGPWVRKIEDLCRNEVMRGRLPDLGEEDTGVLIEGCQELLSGGRGPSHSLLNLFFTRPELQDLLMNGPREL